MLLALGPHRFDISHRALVVARLDGDDLDELRQRARSQTRRCDAVVVTVRAGNRVDALADAVEAARAETDLPVVVRTDDGRALAAALAAGAVAAHHVAGSADPDHLSAAAAAGASVIAGRPARPPVDPRRRADELLELAEAVAGAGVPVERIAVDVGRTVPSVPPTAVSPLEELPLVVRAGWPALVTVDATAMGPANGAALAGATALAIARGARLLATDDERTSARVAAVVERLLRVRDGADEATP